MVFKKESVLERLKRFEEVLSHLETKSCTSLEDYQKETDLQWIIERGLEVASTIIFDIGNRILAGVYRTPAQGYEEILEEIWKKGVLSDELYRNLRGLGGFRNLLVHGYLSLDPRLVYENFRKASQVFPQFIAEIEEWLSRREAEKE